MPAAWSASLCPDVVILDAASASGPGAMRLDPARWSQRLFDRLAADGRHLILAHGDALLRVWLRCEQPDMPLAAVIPFDALAGLRMQAASRCRHWLAGDMSAAMPAGRPTAYQAQRLAMLLAILDLRSRAPLSSHEVARRLVYPHLSIGRGSAWKSSPERRRTQRMIREAEALRDGDYRALLAGGGVRQK